MKIDNYADHYDDKYWRAQKEYHDHEGKVRQYHGPAIDWEGFDTISRAMMKVLPRPPASVLDIGCGGGSLTHRFLDAGYDAYGVDVSQYAVENAVGQMKGRIKQADVTTKPNLGALYDVVMATDFAEHIYASQWDETFNWMCDHTKRFLFLLIAVAPDNEREFVHEHGKEIPREFEVTAVSGHINVRHKAHWIRYFNQHPKVKIRWDLQCVFRMEAEKTEWLRNTIAWGSASTYILERQ